MFLNDKEEAIIGTFLSNADEYEFDDMELVWDNGSKIIANYVSNYENSNDEKKDSPSELQLTEGEKMVLELFRKIPEDRQPEALDLLRVALKMQQKR